MGLFGELQQIKELSSRTAEAMGGVYADPFNEIATVVTVSDPKKLGRVKVEFQDGTTSDWAYVLNVGKGVLSAQFIGSSCLIGKSHGNSGDVFVLGFFNKNPNVGSGGAPVQLATLNEQVAAHRAPASTGDQGLRCNKGQAGHIYLLESEINQDVVVCIRRNNPQEGGEEVWNWKSLTNSKWIEKGFDPGVQDASVTNFSEKRGIPQCNQAMEGDTRDFAEDRKFRTFSVKCGRDENGAYSWRPVGATPVFTRSLLPPDCTEAIHGMDAVLEDGINSQRISCLRYQGQMKWVNPGKREPVQFHSKDAPLTKEKVLDSKGSVPALKEESSGMKPGDSVGNSAKEVLKMAATAIPAAIPTTPLGAALKAAGALSGSFDGAKLLTDIAKTVIVNNGTLPVSSLVSQISSALNSSEVIDDTTAGVLKTLGGVGDQLLRGVQNGTVDSALENIGQKALNQSIRALSPEASSVYFGYMAGGIAGAMDAASALNLSVIPDEINDIIKPVLSIGADVLRSQPQAISKLVGSATGSPGSPPLNQTVSALQSVVPMVPEVVSGVTKALSSGDLGEVASTLASFTNLPTMPKFDGVGDIPKIASTALQALELGKQFLDVFKGGISLEGISKLLGGNPVAGLLGGLTSGLLGGVGGGGECPCDPKCRKTKHFEDSDGNNLLEKCGNIVANSASAYSPDGDPTKNNENEVAKTLGRIATKVGEELCIPNTWDLTEMIQDVKRLGEMAERLNSAKDADWPELWSELIYTFETVEKAFKKTDNNITKVESVERKLIDAQHRLINKLMVGNESFLSQTLLSIVTTSKAIRDVYAYVRRLDAVKKGGGAGVTVTSSLAEVFENIVRIAKLNGVSKKEANFITEKFLKSADKEWKDLNPAKGLVSLTDFVLGLIPKDLPASFDKCLTKNNKDKVLSDSLESKINSPVPPAPQSLLDSKLPTTSRIPSLLDQIIYEQGRAQSGEANC